MQTEFEKAFAKFRSDSFENAFEVAFRKLISTEFSVEEVIRNASESGVHVIEYTEKTFSGEMFSDDEWSTI